MPEHLVNSMYFQTHPLLQCTGAPNMADGHVLLPLTAGCAMLQDLHITDSSEAMLSGRKPPFRLLVKAISRATGQPLPSVHKAVSEGFVVATRRCGR